MLLLHEPYIRMREIGRETGSDFSKMTIERPPNLSSEAVTVLLKAWSEGDPSAPEQVAPLIYAELRRLARRSLRRESAPAQT